MFPHEVRYTIGTFSVIDDCNAQDGALHNIFALLLYRELSDKERLEVAYTLYRLYFIDGWMPARTFFYTFTEQLIDDENPVIVLDRKVPPLDPRTIMMVCKTQCKALNRLWFDSEGFYDDAETDADSEMDSEAEAETETETASEFGSTAASETAAEDVIAAEEDVIVAEDEEVDAGANYPRGAVYDIDPRDESRPRWDP